MTHINRKRKRSLEFIEFLEELRQRYALRLKILVLDNHKIHSNKITKEHLR